MAKNNPTKRPQSLILLMAILLVTPILALSVDIPTGVSAGNFSGVGVNDSYWLRGLSPQQVANLFVELDPVFTSWLISPIAYNTFYVEADGITGFRQRSSLINYKGIGMGVNTGGTPPYVFIQSENDTAGTLPITFWMSTNKVASINETGIYEGISRVCTATNGICPATDLTSYWNSTQILNGTFALNSNIINYTSDEIWINKNSSNAFNFNSSKLSTIYYNATQSEVVAGTIDGGTLADTQHPDGKYDGVTFNFSEVSATPGLDLRINFTNITSFNQGVMRYKTASGLSGAYPIIQMWNYDTSIWEDYPPVSEITTFATITQPVFDSAEHVSNGVAQMRIYKATKGNTGNKYYVDWIAISKGFGTPSGEEVDPYSFHMNQNLNNSGYNISADYFIGDGSLLTDINFNGTTSYNSTQMSNSGGYLNILVSWLTSLFYTKTEIDNSIINNDTFVKNNTSPTFVNATLRTPQFDSIGNVNCYPLKCLSWCVNGSGTDTHTYYNGTGC